MMRYLLLTVGLMVSGVVGCLTLQVSAADTYRLKQWIAPLECTQNEVVNGVNTTTYLTPKECDDLLHPPKPDPGDIKAPDTGYTEPLLAGIFTLIVLAILVLFRMVRKHGAWA